MNKNVLYIRVLLVVIAIVVVLTFSNRSPQHSPSNTWLPSSFNPVGAGHMAFYQTLQELNWPVERWREPLSRLSDYGTGNVLVITRATSREGARGTYSEQELDLIDQWVGKGNTLIALGALDEWDDTRMLLQKYNFSLNKKDDSLSDLFQPFRPDSGQTLELQPSEHATVTGTMVLPATQPFSFSPSPGDVLWQKDEQPYFIEVPHGAGHVILGASARLLSNAWLGKGDNLMIVLGLLAPSGQMPHHIFFEESHHGYSAVYALARLFHHPGVGFAGMLALLGALAFFGASLVRFGPVVPLQRETGRSALEFIDSIADLYMRADVRRDTMKYLFTETHQRVLHRLNLPPTASHDLIAARLQQTSSQLPKWKKLAQRFDSHDYVDGLPPSGWLRVARDLIEIKSAMA